MTIRGVIFDIDGTLIDSNDQHAQSWVDVLGEFEHQVAFERVRPLIGMGGDLLLPELTGIDSQSRKGQKISARRWQIFQATYLRQIRAMPGANELLAHLASRGYKLIVGTSAKNEELKALLHAGGIKDLFDGKTSSDDAETSKPEPDIVLAALEKAGLRPDEAVFVGDTPYDMEAATRSGVSFIGLCCGGWTAEELSEAIAVYDDPLDLLRNLRSGYEDLAASSSRTMPALNRSVTETENMKPTRPTQTNATTSI